MDQPAPVVALEKVSIGYSHGRVQQVLTNRLDEQVLPHQLVSLIGPNGAGKSTLLRTIGRMQPPVSGQIRLMGKDLAEMRARELAQVVSMVLTDRAPVSYVKAAEVVAMGRFPHTGWLGFLSPTDRRKISGAIEQCGIERLVDQPLNRLSDGERQKVMIARALAQDTPLMLLDEPTTHLDITNRVSIVRLLRSLVRDGKKTIVFSTHNVELALQVSDRIWLMHDRGVSSGTPEDLVIQGTLSRVMGSENAPFDMSSGTFRIDQPTAHSVALQGSNPLAYWTRRALERVGFEVHPQASAQIIITDEGQWQLHREGQQYHGRTIEELLRHLTAPSNS